jgi:hypothetical protein
MLAKVAQTATADTADINILMTSPPNKNRSIKRTAGADRLRPPPPKIVKRTLKN